MAIESWKSQLEIARFSQRPIAFMPLVAYFEYYWSLVQLIDSGAELNEEALRKLHDKNEAVSAAIQKLDELAKSGGQTK
jgi:hypothetical protein